MVGHYAYEMWYDSPVRQINNLLWRGPPAIGFGNICYPCRVSFEVGVVNPCHRHHIRSHNEMEGLETGRPDLKE